MEIVKIDKNYIYLNATVSKAAEIGGHYMARSGLWRVPYNLGTLRELYNVGVDVTDMGKTLNYRYKEIDALKSTPYAPLKDSGLRPYQLEDVNFIVNRNCAGVFNEQRTGKTPMMCKALEEIGGRAIIIVPASLVLNWESEIKRWTSLVPCKYYGPKTARVKKLSAKWDVLITTVGMVKSDIAHLKNIVYDTIVIDEAHFLRNYGTQQSKAIFDITKGIKRRYALTGTPATKHPSDVYGIFHFLDPDKWSSYWQFTERYFKTVEAFFGGKDVRDFVNADRRREFEEIVNVMSIQRKRKDVMKWLPDKQYQTIELDMDAKQSKYYKDILETFMSDEIEVDAPTVLTQMLRLRQITSCPNVFTSSATSGAKFEFIKEWLKNNNEPIVVFSNFTSGLKKLKKELGAYNVGMVTGEVSKHDRDVNVRLFQSGKLDVLLCNIEAAGVGLTLDSAGTVIFLDRHYNPAQNEQAEDRIVATTQDSNLSALIIDLVCKNSIDEHILDIVKQKKDVTKVVNEYKNLKEWLR